jgi:hypothetical protein
MLVLASLLVTAILAPAPSSELRNPMGPETSPRSAPTTATAGRAVCPYQCKDGELRVPAFPGVANAKPASRGAVEPGLRDPFDTPHRATMPKVHEPSPRRVRAPGPRPATPAGELRSPFGRA